MGPPRTLTALAVAASAGLGAGLLAAVAGGAGIPVDEPAAVSESAERDVQALADGRCDIATVEALAGRHPGVRQFVVLATNSFADTHGFASVAVRRSDGRWACQTDPVPARFGKTGTRPLILRRSGDGTTPAGAFPLGSTTAWDGQRFSVFGNRPDPGVRAGVGYRAVRREDCWGARPGNSSYNHLVAAPGCGGPDEWLQRYGDVYSHAAVIGANLEPISGDAPGETPYAAAIFLHRNSYSGSSTRPTSGCVSLAQHDLETALRLLDPALDPHFAIGPTSWLRSTA
ncbi:MAG: L,D-transpeptidase family protein [Acidimicrobiia bacterium]|nr:L,D-transpeptidase family protein [Acidimicrobiia bacterium]